MIYSKNKEENFVHTSQYGKLEMKQKSFKTQKNGNLDFTNLGFGGVPIGNLYRELTDEEATRQFVQHGTMAYGTLIQLPNMVMGAAKSEWAKS